MGARRWVLVDTLWTQADNRYATRLLAYIKRLPARTITGFQVRAQNNTGGLAASDLELTVCPLTADGYPDLNNALRTCVATSLGSNSRTIWTLPTAYTTTDGEWLAFVVKNISSDPATKYGQQSIAGQDHMGVAEYPSITLQSDDSGSTWRLVGFNAGFVACSDGDLHYGEPSGAAGWWSALALYGTNVLANGFALPRPAKVTQASARIYRVGNVLSTSLLLQIRRYDDLSLVGTVATIPYAQIGTASNQWRYGGRLDDPLLLDAGEYYIWATLADNVGDASNYLRCDGITTEYRRGANDPTSLCLGSRYGASGATTSATWHSGFGLELTDPDGAPPAVSRRPDFSGGFNL